MNRAERLLLGYLLVEQKQKKVEPVSPFLGRGGGISRIQDAADVDTSAIGDGKVPVFRTASMKHEYETGGGGGGAPTDAEYVVTALNETLTAEKLHSALTGADLHDPKAHDQALSTITGHDKAVHDALAIDAATLEGNTKVQVQDHAPQAHTLASHSTKAHSELTNVTSNQHHAKVHNLAHVDHPDVNISSPTNGQMVIYNGASGKWENLDPNVTVVDVNIPSQTTLLSVGDGGGSLTVDGPVVAAASSTIYNVTMTNANTEYSQALPANTKKFTVHTRDETAFRLAFVTGKVATPTEPYWTIPANKQYYEDHVNLTGVTLYVASSSAGKVVEIIVWT